MRQSVLPVLGILAIVLATLSPAQERVRVTTGAGDVQVITIETDAGVQTLRQTSATVTNLRLVEVQGATDTAVLWDEIAEGQATAWYAVSADGDSFPRVVPANYRLRLRWGHFDPVAGLPAVAAHLDVSGSNQLWLVQFATQMLPGYAEAVRIEGGELCFPVHMHAQAVRMTASEAAQVAQLDCVRFVGPYHAAYKLDETLLFEQRRGYADVPSRPINVQTIQIGEAMKGRVIEQVEAFGGRIIDRNPNGSFFTADLNTFQVAATARLDEVQWMDLWTAPEDDMDIARTFHGATYIENTAGFTGQGVRGEVLDSGTRASHQEFQATPLIPHGGLVSGSHGTNTYGQVFSSGVDAGARGMLPAGQGIAAFYNSFSGGSRYNHTAELVDPGNVYRAVFQTNSWGGGRTLNYTTDSAEIDRIIHDHQFLITQSQSNAGDQMSRPQAWGKNIVAVGGVRHQGTLTETDDAWSGGGSIGPAADGRTKPDLASFYDNIRTTASSSDTAYTNTFGGTSGATPIVGGSFGLLFEMWSTGIFGNAVSGSDVFDNRPAYTTAKAIMVNQATQWNFTGPGDDPDRDMQGYGRPDLQKIYDLRGSMFIVNNNDPVGPLGSNTYSLTVPAGTPELLATLVWSDPAGSPGTTPVIVNNLDMRLVSPTGVVWNGNVGLRNSMTSSPNGAPDGINTLEKVIIPNPEIGNWVMEIIGSNVVVDTDPVTPGTNVIYSLAVAGVVAGPPAPPPFGLVFQTTTGLGNLQLGIVSMPMTASYGYTLFSNDTSGFPGGGNLLGLRADYLTLQGLITPRSAGNPFNFPVGVPGVYPDVDLVLPPGAIGFTGSTDGMAIVFDGANGLVGTSRVVRVNW